MTTTMAGVTTGIMLGGARAALAGTLDDSQSTLLLRMVQDIYPHPDLLQVAHYQAIADTVVTGLEGDADKTAALTDGLANSSGQIGRNDMNHTTGGVSAVLPEKVHMFRGTSVAGIVGDEVHHDPARGFSGGYYLEFLSLGLPFMAAFLEPGDTGWGRSVARALEGYDRMSGVWVLGEDLAQERSAITLHPNEKDQHGLPVPIVSKTPHNNDYEMTAHM